MNLYAHFRTEEKINFLEKLGYEVIKVSERMGYPCYHDDMEYENVVVYGVFKSGVEVNKPCGQNFKEEEWLDNAFSEEVRYKLKKLILN